MNETYDTCFLKGLTEKILAKWKAKNELPDEERSREELHSMLHMIDGYYFPHLIITLCEVYDDYQEAFNPSPSLKDLEENIKTK